MIAVETLVAEEPSPTDSLTSVVTSRAILYKACTMGNDVPRNLALLSSLTA